MNEIWERLEEMAQRIGENPDLASGDNISVIIGIADNKEEKINALCVSGEGEGIFEMLSVIAERIEEEFVGADNPNLN